MNTYSFFRIWLQLGLRPTRISLRVNLDSFLHRILSAYLSTLLFKYAKDFGYDLKLSMLFAYVRDQPTLTLNMLSRNMNSHPRPKI